MTLPDFHDSRPYTHPDLPGTWRLSTVGPNTIHLRRESDNLITAEQIADWPGDWQPTDEPHATIPRPSECRFPEHMTAITLLRQIAGPYRSIRASSRPRGVTEAIALLDRLDALAEHQWCPVCKTYHADPGERTDAGYLTRPCPVIPADDPRNIAENYGRP